MFLENQKQKYQHGWIEVIAGSMFSGKTEELLRRLRRAKIAGQKIKIFKSSLDKRYSSEKIVSHDANELIAQPIDNEKDILKISKDTQVIGIDEAQFFSDNLVNISNELANTGKRVIIAGLDMDYKGMPFGPMPKLFSIAEYITKVHAICIKCGNLAHFSHRLNLSDKLVELGAQNTYEPLCRYCYNKQ